MTQVKNRPTDIQGQRSLGASGATSPATRAPHGSARAADRPFDEVESVARIGSYSTDLLAGRWVSSKGLDAIFGIDAAFDRSVEGWASLVHPADREAMVAYLIDEVVGRAQPFDRQYRIVRADTGAERWVHGRGALELDGSGRPVRMLGTIADITEQVATEKERARLVEGLRRSERNLAEAQRISHIGSWDWDADSDTIWWSDEYYRIYGLDPTKPASNYRDHLTAYTPESAERLDAAVQRGLETGEPYEVDLELAQPTPDTRWIVARGEAKRDPNGRIRGFRGTAQNSTERKRAEEALRAASSYARGLIEASLDPLVTISLDGVVTDVNAATERVTGAQRDRLIGADFADYFTEPAKARAGYQEVLAKGFVRDYPLTIRDALGRTTDVLYNATVYHNEAGELQGVFAAARDVTERRRAEAALHRLNRELRAISLCNQALVRATDEQALLDEICRIVCDEAGYRMAWVGWAERDEARTVRPAAWAGHEDGYLAGTGITWADAERGRGPTGTAIRTGATTCAQGYAADPGLAPWREGALARGYRSSIALPLKDGAGAALGAFTVYAREPGAFTPDEIRLLEELAGDLAFGVAGLRARAERAQAEEAVARSQAGLEEAQRIARVGSWGWVAATDTPTWSREMCRMLDTGPDKPVPKLAEQDSLYTPDSMARMRAGVQRTMQTGAPYEVELERVREDGSRLWLLSRGERWFDEAGHLIGLRGTALDITERRLAEATLRASEEQNRRFVRDDIAAVFVTTPDGRVTSCNPEFARMLGFASEGEALAANITSAHADPADWAPLPAELREHGRIERRELAWRRADGAPVAALVTAIGDFGEAGELAAIRAYAIDVTERKRLEEQYRQAQKMEVVGQFAGGIAHDFNNLLTAIKGYGGFLRADLPEDDERSQADLGEMLAAADRAELLIRQLLAFSRRQVLAPVALAPAEVVERIAPMLRRVLGEQVGLVTSSGSHTGRVRADRSQLEQVIVNLAVNARDAMPGGGRLAIETAVVELDAGYAAAHPDATPGVYVALTVSDHGVGMGQETLSHLFEPFFTTKPEGKGTGLGLATVYGIVHQSGGSVSVDSEPGRGTTVRIYLPRLAEDGEVAVPESDGRAAVPLGTETVLLVEDDPAVRAYARRVLAGLGYLVTEAATGADALRIAAAHEGIFDLLVTDIVMAGMQGLEVARRLIATRPDMKVLYMSGFADNQPGQADRLADLPFLAKPFSSEALGRAVRSVLDSTIREPS